MVNHRNSTEHLVIWLGPEADGNARWVPTDAAGRPSGTIQSGPLAAAAGLAARRTVTVLVPGEHVLLTTADLPPVHGARMRQALAFALEDQITVDVESLHYVAGPQDDSGRTPVAAIDRAWLRARLEGMESAGIRPTSLVPDFLALPWQAGVCRIARDGGRVLVRDGSISGFACEPEILDALLASRGRSATEPVQVDGDLLAALLPQAVAPVLDLLDGEFVVRRPRTQALGAWRLPAALSAVLAIVMVTGWMVQYRNVAAEHEALRAEIETLFTSLVPGEPMADPRAQVERMLGRGGSGSDELLLMLEATAVAFDAHPEIEIASLAFSGGRLDLTVSAGSAEQLDGLRERLGAGTGIEAEIASATSRGDRVEGQLSLRMAST